MDLRLGQSSRASIIPGSGDGRGVGRAVGHAFGQAMGQARNQAIGQAKDHAPKAEAMVARCIERTRPIWTWLSIEWRRLGTASALLLIVGVLLHAMFGANGMVVYRQKRAEMQSLRSEVDRLQKENDQYVEQIKSLKSDPAAIEKEAREQLHYTRPGEVIYVAPEPPPKPSSPTGRATNEK
jgi:cell division protein FtsB